MAEKQPLTTQYLGDRFSNPFDLVNHAIKLARNKIASGRSPRVDTTVRNEAYIVLAEIAQKKDFFDDISTNGKQSSDNSAKHRNDADNESEKKTQGRSSLRRL